jgi:hypothetical protein
VRSHFSVFGYEFRERRLFVQFNDPALGGLALPCLRTAPAKGIWTPKLSQQRPENGVQVNNNPGTERAALAREPRRPLRPVHFNWQMKMAYSETTNADPRYAAGRSVAATAALPRGSASPVARRPRRRLQRDVASGTELSIRNLGQNCVMVALPTIQFGDARNRLLSAVRQAPRGMHPGPLMACQRANLD